MLAMTASHHDLDLDTLEVLARAQDIGPAVVAACPAIIGAVVLATCNRFELYLDLDAPLNARTLRHASRHVAQLIEVHTAVPATLAERAFKVRAATEVAHHLFTVAAGLDSMVVGEREISGQVKRALAASRAARANSPTLELLFQTASRTSKRVGTETTLGGAGRSLVALGLDLAATDLPPYPQVRAVLIGTGSYAGASLAALRARGCQDVRVYSQSGRAQAFADSHQIEPVDDLVSALADADIVVSCSGARGRAPSATGSDHGTGETLGHILQAAHVVTARSQAALDAGDEASGRSMVVLDLALHRDVDPHVADVAGVLLYDLATLGAHSPAVSSGLVAQAQQIVDAAARDFEDTRLGRAADKAVIALLDDAERQIAAEVATMVAGLGGRGLASSDAEAEHMARSVRRRVHAELHPKIVAARAAAVAEARRRAVDVVAGAQGIAAGAVGFAGADGAGADAVDCGSLKGR